VLASNIPAFSVLALKVHRFLDGERLAGRWQRGVGTFLYGVRIVLYILWLAIAVACVDAAIA
jgi:hypothetical protein